MSDIHILERIDSILHERKSAQAADSYAASLYQKGTLAILDKISEEATEVVTAGAKENDARLACEIADLWFHCQVLLAQRNVSVDAVFNELEKRFGKSGLEEKRKRSK